MRVLLCGPTHTIFMKELAKHLTQQGVMVDCLDPAALVFFEDNYSRKEELGHPENRVLRLFWKIKQVASLLRSRPRYDAVNLHFMTRTFVPLLPFLKLYSRRLVLTIWGSDYNAATEQSKRHCRPLVRYADTITFANETMRRSFVEYYGESVDRKTHICRFGSDKFGAIDGLLADSDQATLRAELGLPADKRIVTCGYSADRGHQFEAVIDQLEQLSDAHRQQFFFVFPMTYGDIPYRAEILERLAVSSLQHRVLTEFMSDEEVARWRIASDFMLQLRTVDSFSGSMQENLYGRTLVVYGSWLPYASFADEGLVFWPVDAISEVNATMLRLHDSFEERLAETENNPTIIRALSSWEVTISGWLSVYSSEPETGA